MNRTCLSPYYRRSSCLFALLRAFSLLRGIPAYAQFTLVKISGDSFNNPESQHKTEVEPDTYSWGSTMDGRFFKWHEFPAAAGQTWDSPSPPTAGKTWTHGLLPGLTVHYKQGTHEAASDAFGGVQRQVRSVVDFQLSLLTPSELTWLPAAPKMVSTGAIRSWWTTGPRTTRIAGLPATTIPKSPLLRQLLHGMGRKRFGPYEHLHGRGQDLGTS